MSNATLSIRGRGKFECETLEDAQRLYAMMRDESGEGGSTFPSGVVRLPSGKKYQISYNGRAWNGDRVVSNFDNVAMRAKEICDACADGEPDPSLHSGCEYAHRMLA